jgi:hypothetical protein
MSIRTNEVGDKFIEHNNELKALKFAFKKLKTEINEKMTWANRNFFSTTTKLLLLGRRHCELISMSIERGLANDIEVEVFDFANLDTPKLSLWGMPIYVSMMEPYKIEIIVGSENIVEDTLSVIGDEDYGLGKKPLIDINVLINDLPDTMKFKRVN